jgi:cysteine desulfurase
MRTVIDVEAERAQTPGSLGGIFLDSAGSSLPPRRVIEEMVSHLRREAEVGGYRAAAERSEDLEELYASIGQLLGCASHTLALTDSATRAWIQFVTSLRWRPGDRVLVCGVEYASNAIPLLQRARADGIRIEVVPSDPTGRVDLAALEAMLDERVRLVSLVHVPTNSGLVNPVREVVELAHRAGALVLLDACQSVGQFAVDVTDLGVDALSATGRKWLRGPRGTGLLYVAPRLLTQLEPAAADMRGATWTAATTYELTADATRFELWEHSVGARLGLRVAVEHLLGLGVDNVEKTVRGRAAHLRAGLVEVPGVAVHDHGDDLCGIVSFTLDGRRAEQVRDELAARGVTVSVSAAGSTLLDMEARGLESVVRASPHYFVTERQLDQTIEAVRASRL